MQGQRGEVGKEARNVREKEKKDTGKERKVGK